jgi:hypothetical protein
LRVPGSFPEEVSSSEEDNNLPFIPLHRAKRKRGKRRTREGVPEVSPTIPPSLVNNETITHQRFVNRFDNPVFPSQTARPTRPGLQRNTTIPIHRPIAETPAESVGAERNPFLRSLFLKAVEYGASLLRKDLAGYVSGKQWKDFRYTSYNGKFEDIRHGVLTMQDCIDDDDFHESPWKIYRFAAYRYFDDYVPERDNILVFWEVYRQFNDGKFIEYVDKWGDHLISRTGSDMI